MVTWFGPDMIPLMDHMVDIIGWGSWPCERPFASSILVMCSLVLSVLREGQIWVDYRHRTVRRYHPSRAPIMYGIYKD